MKNATFGTHKEKSFFCGQIQRDGFWQVTGTDATYKKQIGDDKKMSKCENDKGGEIVKRQSNYPPAQINNIPAEKAKAITNDVLHFKDASKPETDIEKVRRIDEFFEYCAESGMRPGIESLCLALKINRSTLLRWSRGEGASDYLRDAVCEAKATIGGFLEQASMRGNVNPATGIFLAKNWLGYKDNLGIEEITPQEKNDTSANLSEIAERIGVISRNKAGGGSDENSDDEIPMFG